MHTARCDIKYNAKFHTITMADLLAKTSPSYDEIASKVEDATSVKRKINEQATLPKKRGKYAQHQDRTAHAKQVIKATISAKEAQQKQTAKRWNPKITLTLEEKQACHELCILLVGKENAVQYCNEVVHDLSKLIIHANFHARHGGHAELTLTITDLIRIFIAQNGKCARSGFTLQGVNHLVQGDSFRIKIALKNPNVGKIAGNILLICRYASVVSEADFLAIRQVFIENYGSISESQLNEYMRALRELCHGRMRGAEWRTIKRGHDVPECNQQFLMLQYLKQRGKCFYSGRIFRLILTENDIGLEDSMSLERPDSNRGYAKDNCVWCCLQFNSFRQFSRETFIFFKHIHKNPVPVNLISDAQNALVLHKKKAQSSNRNILKLFGSRWLCITCRVYLPKEAFSVWRNRQKLDSECKDCKAKRGKEYYFTPRGFLLHLIRRCHSATLIRKQSFDKSNEFRIANGKTPRIPNDNQFTIPSIDMRWIVAQLVRQGGRCKISHCPLDIRPGLITSMSVERENESIGYHPSNCVLICVTFQGTLVQWTRERFVRNFEPDDGDITYRNAFCLGML